MDDSTKHPPSSDALHQSYHSFAAAPLSPADAPPPDAPPPDAPPPDAPPVTSVAHNPPEQSDKDKKIQAELLDFNQ